jgi:hypothetical protein
MLLLFLLLLQNIFKALPAVVSYQQQYVLTGTAAKNPKLVHLRLELIPFSRVALTLDAKLSHEKW